MLTWLTGNWFNLLSAVGIVGGLFFTAFSFRAETKSRQVSNLLIITNNHREIWSELYTRPELARVKDKEVNLLKNPITPAEVLFVKFLILHLSSTYRAMKNGVFIKPEETREDIRQFLSLPIPKEVWKRIKVFQDKEFIDFVEGCLKSNTQQQ